MFDDAYDVKRRGQQDVTPQCSINVDKIFKRNIVALYGRRVPCVCDFIEINPGNKTFKSERNTFMVL